MQEFFNKFDIKDKKSKYFFQKACIYQKKAVP